MKLFDVSTLHGTLGENFFEKKWPQNMLKTRLDTFGSDFVHFQNFKKFLIFLKIFEDSTLHGTLGKFFLRKSYPKTCSKHVWTLLGAIWAFVEFWKKFDFLENFRSVDPPWNTGQIFFSNKIPQNMFKTRLDTFGNDFGYFWKFEIFLLFLRIFSKSLPHILSPENWSHIFKFGNLNS